MGSNDNFEKLLASMNAEERKKKAEVKPAKKFVKNFFIKDNGEYIFRLFPNLKDPMGSPFYKAYVHLGYILPNTKKYFPFKCLGNRCPLCENYRQKSQKGDRNAWRFEAREQFIYYGIDQKGDIIKASFTEKIHQTIKKALEDELKNKENPYNPLDLDNGCFLKFRKDTNEKNGKQYPVYSIQVLRGSAKSIKPKLREILLKLPDLKDTLTKFSEQDYVDVLHNKSIDIKKSNKKNKPEPKQVFNKEEEPNDSEKTEENQELDLKDIMEDGNKKD